MVVSQWTAFELVTVPRKRRLMWSIAIMALGSSNVALTVLQLRHSIPCLSLSPVAVLSSYCTIALNITSYLHCSQLMPAISTTRMLRIGNLQVWS